MNEDQWFYKDTDGMVKGPVSSDELLELLSKKIILGNTIVSPQYKPDWTHLSSLIESGCLSKKHLIPAESVNIDKLLSDFKLTREASIEQLESVYGTKIKEIWEQEKPDAVVIKVKKIDESCNYIRLFLKGEIEKREHDIKVEYEKRERDINDAKIASYYEIFGLAPDATLADVHRAHDLLINTYDKIPLSSKDPTDNKLEQISEAYRGLFKHLTKRKNAPSDLKPEDPISGYEENNENKESYDFRNELGPRSYEDEIGRSKDKKHLRKSKRSQSHQEEHKRTSPPSTGVRMIIYIFWLIASLIILGVVRSVAQQNFPEHASIIIGMAGATIIYIFFSIKERFLSGKKS